MKINMTPASLRTMMRLFPTVYDYYNWIISGVGKRFVIPMLIVGKKLSQTDIWQVVRWMQSGFFGARTKARNVIQHEHHQPEKHMQNMLMHFIGRKGAVLLMSDQLVVGGDGTDIVERGSDHRRHGSL